MFNRDDQFIAALSYQFIGDREDIQTQAPEGDENHGSYQLFNLTLSYELANGLVPYLTHEEAFVRIQNLFDRHYSQAFGLPSPPINYEAGIKVGFECNIVCQKLGWTVRDRGSARECAPSAI